MNHVAKMFACGDNRINGLKAFSSLPFLFTRAEKVGVSNRFCYSARYEGRSEPKIDRKQQRPQHT